MLSRVPTVKASGTIYIRADGSIDSPTAPIQRNGDIYTLTGNIIIDVVGHGIMVERSNIVIDGNGYTIQGSFTYSYGILLSGIYNVTIIDVDIKYFYVGIFLNSSSNNVLSGNSITDDGYGIGLHYSSDNNRITGNSIGASSSHTMPVYVGIQLEYSSANVILGNNIVGNEVSGVSFISSSNNVIYHNNFANNTYQFDAVKSVNIWDDGYPSDGNYWSDYSGVDLFSGPYQNETGSDRIGDIPYTMDVDNVDNYPLIYPYGYVPSPDFNNDGIIDIFDLVRMALAYGSVPGNPIWNPYVDLNQDSIIDIFDLVTVAVNFGKQWTPP